MSQINHLNFVRMKAIYVSFENMSNTMNSVTIYTHVFDRNMKYVRLGDFVWRPFGIDLKMSAILSLDIVHPVYGYPMQSRLHSMPVIEADSFGQVLVDHQRPLHEVLQHLVDALGTVNSFPLTLDKHQNMLSVALSFLDTRLVEACDEPGYDAILALKSYVIALGETCLPMSAALLDDLCQREAWRRLREKKAHVLQTAWKEAISNPRYEACKRRLLREFNDFAASISYLNKPQQWA